MSQCLGGKWSDISDKYAFSAQKVTGRILIDLLNAIFDYDLN